MKYLPPILLLLVLCHSTAQASGKKACIADLTVRIPAHHTEERFYGFAEGDEILFSMKEEDHHTLKEVEIIEYPSVSRFKDYETAKIRNQVVIAHRKSIYAFRLVNEAGEERICHITIYRIPAEGRENFNTAVAWKNVFDTTYQTIEETYVIRRDTSVVTLADQVARVHSRTTIDFSPNRNVIALNLPEHTASWTYWIGVGAEGQKNYKEALERFLHSTARVAINIPEYGPLIALALEGVNFFTISPTGDNVHYALLTDEKEMQNYKEGKSYKALREGNVVTDFAQMYKPLSGKVYIGLMNDNLHDAIDVNVKVLAVVVKEVTGRRTSQKMNVNCRKAACLAE